MSAARGLPMSAARVGRWVGTKALTHLAVHGYPMGFGTVPSALRLYLYLSVPCDRLRDQVRLRDHGSAAFTISPAAEPSAAPCSTSCRATSSGVRPSGPLRACTSAPPRSSALARSAEMNSAWCSGVVKSRVAANHRTMGLVG